MLWRRWLGRKGCGLDAGVCAVVFACMLLMRLCRVVAPMIRQPLVVPSAMCNALASMARPKRLWPRRRCVRCGICLYVINAFVQGGGADDPTAAGRPVGNVQCSGVDGSAEKAVASTQVCALWYLLVCY